MKTIVILGAAVVAAACGSSPKPETAVPARVMTSSGVAAGDCAEARRRAAAEPDLAVDRIPAVVAQSPPPFERMPSRVKALVDRNGASVKANVVIDTLGRPIMSTFTVVESRPHAWMAQNVRSVMPRWKFTPAELAGCKVARVFKFSANAPKKR